MFALLVAVYDLIDRTATFPVNRGGVVVITGATSGLGQDAAYHIARDLGYIVLAGARTQEKADALQADASKHGVPAERFEAIVLTSPRPSTLLRPSRRQGKDGIRTGVLRGRVNNAGVINRQLGGDEYRRWRCTNGYST